MLVVMCIINSFLTAYNLSTEQNTFLFNLITFFILILGKSCLMKHIILTCMMYKTVSTSMKTTLKASLFLPFCRGSLEGKREQKSYKALLEDPMLRFSGLYQENCSDLYVTCQVFAEGKPLALPVRTSYKAFSTRWK